MFAKTANSKNNNHQPATSKKSITDSPKKKKEINNATTNSISSSISSSSSNNNNLGLRVPGSNWQKFKSLIAEAAAADSQPGNPAKKQKKLRNHSKPKSNNNNQSSNPSQQQQTQLTPSMNNLRVDESDATPIQQQQPNVATAQQQQNAQPQQQQQVTKRSNKDRPTDQLTRAIAMDCEMVGIGEGGTDSMIARVSLVNRHNVCVYDKYVKPTEEVKDYRTAVSGIQPHHLQSGEDFKQVQREVAEILKGRILVGHALHNDLAVLYLSHPRRYQRDTSRYKLFRKVTKGNTPSLKRLAAELLGVDIQTGEHNSVEDAKAAMQLYQQFRNKWENDIRKR